MAAVTLYNKDVVGQLALSADFFPHLSELPLETHHEQTAASLGVGRQRHRATA